MDPLIDSIGGLLAAQWVGLAFAFASVGKLQDRSGAILAVERFQLLPAPIARMVGSLLPWIELLLACSLIAGVASRTGASVAIALLVVFSIAQAAVLLQGRRVECGCFGSDSSEPIHWLDLGRNAFLIVCCVWSVRASSGYAESFRVVPGLARFETLSIQLTGTGVFLQYAVIQSVVAIRRHEAEYQNGIRAQQKALAVQSLPVGSQ